MSGETTVRRAAHAAPSDWGRLNSRLLLVNLAILVAPVAMFLATYLVAGKTNLQILITLGSLFLTFLVISGIGLMRLMTTRYRVGEDMVELQSGLLFRSRRSIPLDRIRSVDLTANPLHRLFGLTTLTIGTGEQSSSAGQRLSLDGISAADAAELRRQLIERRDAGRGLGAAAEDDGPISELDWSWLRYGPLSVWGVGGVFIAAASVYRTLHELKVDPLEWGVVKDLEHRFGSVPLWYGVLVALAVVVVLGIAGSTGAFIESWSGYRLEREDGGMFRVRRGLFVTRSVSIEQRRLRGVELVEPIPLRWAKAARLNAVASGLGNLEDNRRRRALTPPVPRAEARRVATEVLGEHPALTVRDGLLGHPRAALRRRVNQALIWSVLIAAVPFGLGVWLGPAWVTVGCVTGAVLVPVLVAFAVDAYRTLGHGIRGRYLVTSAGTFAHRTVALEREGIIGWKITRTPFQRRAGLLTLGATTAAGEGVYKVRDVSTGQGIALAEDAVPQLLLPFLERAPRSARRG
ncbi:PH domain-containing protein [Streptomyces sp. LX-29]|uniref:PH domain-containing protein n=1 Tax=Streptomyces sp. LX-29 TaxID=2900152 RepID=UPI00240DC7C2|nr:PH domain-containing protein [Streptomyces sp. LX-29]WFB09500.1 PH domain-containing protein [Streptomyces sp. LX-29]